MESLSTGDEATVTGSGTRRYRLRIKSSHFPYRGPGTYWMHVEQRVDETFTELASLPVEIVIVDNGAPTSQRG